MALRHRAFSLDADGFREKIIPIVAALDAGDARPAFREALKVIEQTSPARWVLAEAGSALTDIRQPDSMGLPEGEEAERYLSHASTIPSYKLGYWLLLIFSNFLQSAQGIGPEYSILDRVLQDLTWTDHERRLLFEGVPVSVLLKPGTVRVSPVTHSDPYWHWMIPMNSKARGWLSRAQISALLQHLLLEEPSIRRFDYRRFGDPWQEAPIINHDGQLGYYARLNTAYDGAVSMLRAAERAQLELYSVLAYR